MSNHLNIADEQSRQGGDYTGVNDYVIFKFDIVGDLRPAFNWNTKQLFVYIAAEYSTPKNVLLVISFLILNSH